MKRSWILLAGLMLLASACTPAAPDLPAEPATLEPPAVEVVENTATPEPTPLPEATATPAISPSPEISFEKATYQDAANGFSLDYPVQWAFDGGEQHSRGGYVQFYSWDWQPGEAVEAIPPDETVLTVLVNLWDPKNDLEAFIEVRKLAWENSGITLLAEEALLFGDDHPAQQFIVQGADGLQSFFLFTTIGENYLTLSGSGDLQLLAEVAGTLRFDQ